MPIRLFVDAGHLRGFISIEGGRVVETDPNLRQELKGRRVDYLDWWLSIKNANVYEPDDLPPE